MCEVYGNRCGEPLPASADQMRGLTCRLARFAEARRFYGETLGLPETLATDSVAIFDTGQAKLIIEYVRDGDREAGGLVGRFTAFSFTVTSMETALTELGHQRIEWISQS